MRPPRPFPEGSAERLEQALRQARSKAEFQRVQCVWLRAGLGLNALDGLKDKLPSLDRLGLQIPLQGNIDGHENLLFVAARFTGPLPSGSVGVTSGTDR